MDNLYQRNFETHTAQAYVQNSRTESISEETNKKAYSILIFLMFNKFVNDYIILRDKPE